MRNVQITDDWLYSQMSQLGDKCLQAMPKEEEIEYQIEMKKTIDRIKELNK